MITCTFEGGQHSAGLRHVVGAIFVFNKEKTQLLLIQRSGKFSEPYKWAPPGGYMGRNETTSDMVVRETLEETGWKVSVTALLRINDNPHRPKEDKQNVDFVFLGESIEQVGRPDPEEIADVQWFDLDKLPSPEESAFDHYDNLQLSLAYLKQPFPVPILGKIPAEISHSIY